MRGNVLQILGIAVIVHGVEVVDLQVHVDEYIIAVLVLYEVALRVKQVITVVHASALVIHVARAVISIG